MQLGLSILTTNHLNKEKKRKKDLRNLFDKDIVQVERKWEYKDIWILCARKYYKYKSTQGFRIQLA